MRCHTLLTVHGDTLKGKSREVSRLFLDIQINL